MATDLTTGGGGEGAIRQFHHELTRGEDEFARALPAQMQVSKFVRCIMTAVQMNPKLLQCDRKSLWAAAMQAAQDGLYPDGRYGVIIPYASNVAKKGEKEQWVSIAQWQPMILGVYQKMHNTGKLKDITARIVYENDEFEYEEGDDEHITHRPKVFSDRGKPIGVYAIARTTNGGVYRETVSIDEINRIRSFSKSPNSPAWRDHWDEMAKVKVVRRLAKRLPISADDMGWFVGEDDGGGAVAAGSGPQLPPPKWDDIKSAADARLTENNTNLVTDESTTSESTTTPPYVLDPRYRSFNVTNPGLAYSPPPAPPLPDDKEP